MDDFLDRGSELSDLEQTINETLSSIVIAGELPDSGAFLERLQCPDGFFIEAEGVQHDYKDEYPFSNSNDHFGGIMRLVCAFHNTFGGLIIFGVDDKSKKAGKNKVLIDPEKINRRLREVLTQSVIVCHKKYETKTGYVDVILIPKRPVGVPPVRLKQSIGKYKDTKIFIRVGAEVLDADGTQLDFLYGPRSSPFGEDSEVIKSAAFSLPASPATIDEFVGRFDVLERTATWLTSSNEPRLFLWGHGGSGKSTIAYEFAKIVGENGAILKNRSGFSFDRVIYLTAKKQYLNPLTAKIEKYQGTDFSTARELFEAILLFSNWSDEDFSVFSDEYIEDQLRELLDIETQLIVIDDIDTLATSNEDSGMEQLFYLVARSRLGSKLLYTQRNLPSHALRSAVEVPALHLEEEFPSFVAACCRQFQVPSPNKEELDKISLLSECRPLAIETMIGLRRISSTYADAIKRWNSNASDARRYLFEREYDKLSSENRGRHLLAALCAFGCEQPVDVLKSILSFSDEQMQDGISETKDMFLRVEYRADSLGDQLSLGAATQSFLIEVSKHLDRYSTIEARVRNFLSQTQSTPPILTILRERARRYWVQGAALESLKVLQTPELPKVITEHPDFKACLGVAYAKCNPPRAAEAREAFASANLLGCVEYDMYNEWLIMEKAVGASLTRGIDVCELVIENKRFDHRSRSYFYRQLAYLQYKKTWEAELHSPDESINLLKQSMLNNINAFIYAKKTNYNSIGIFSIQVNESIKRLSESARRKGAPIIFFDAIDSISKMDECFSEFIDSIIYGVDNICSGVDAANKISMRRQLNKLIGLIDNGVYAVNNGAKVEKFKANIKSHIEGMK